MYVDTVRNKLYIALGDEGIQAINVDGTGRKPLFYEDARSLTVDLKMGYCTVRLATVQLLNVRLRY